MLLAKLFLLCSLRTYLIHLLVEVDVVATLAKSFVVEKVVFVGIEFVNLIDNPYFG